MWLRRSAFALCASALALAACGGRNRNYIESEPLPVDGGAADASTADARRDEGPEAGEGERCDGLDNDGDGVVDEGCLCNGRATQACFVGLPARAGVGACARGTQTCTMSVEFGTWGACVGSGAASTEVCDNHVDDDCDGMVDEGCEPAECMPTREICGNRIDDDCDGMVDEHCERPTVGAVARAAPFGAGRIVVWGDEHVTFESYGEAPRAFWRQLFAWLACPSAGCSMAGRRIGTLERLPTRALSDLTAAGAVVTNYAGDLSQIDVLVLAAGGGSVVDPVALATWVRAGGAVLALSVGFGDDSEECDRLLSPLRNLPLWFNCEYAAPWGPITEVSPTHPVTAGLPLDAVPFENGRWVFEEPESGSTILAIVPP